jgi:2-dehydropantoate 2-reductase
MTMQKICIFGAGAVGGYMAARLARAGNQVSAVARGAHLAAMRARGIEVRGEGDAFTARVHASDRPEDLGPQDLIISTVKAHGLPEAASQILPLLHEQTVVVYAVNGIPWWYSHGLPQGNVPRLARLDPNGVLDRTIGPDRVLGCVIRSPNELLGPGIVKNNQGANRFALGEPDGTLSPRLLDAVALLNTGLPGAVATGDIRAEIWKKLLVNLPLAMLATLTVSTLPDLFADPATCDLLVRIASETTAVAAACGVQVDYDLPTQIAHAGTHRHPPSILQDLLAGRALELDALVYAVQDLARNAKVPTPLLDITEALLSHRARSPLRMN